MKIRKYLKEKGLMIRSPQKIEEVGRRMEEVEQEIRKNLAKSSSENLSINLSKAVQEYNERLAWQARLVNKDLIEYRRNFLLICY